MAAGKELREFAQQTSKVNNQSQAAIRMLGITAANMQETIIADIAAMISQGHRDALEGYILCLSRIVSHKIAWRCITEAFSQKNEAVPKKYFELFGQEYTNPPPPKSQMTVEK